MRRALSLLLFIVLVCSSCRYNPVSTIPPAQIDSLYLVLSTVSGWTGYEDRLDSGITDQSGVRAEVLGTGRWGVSDSRGYFEIDSVPLGTYNIMLTADGYDTLNLLQNILPSVGWRNGNTGENERGALLRPTDLQFRIDSVVKVFRQVPDGVKISILNRDTSDFWGTSEIVLFFGKHSSVSASWDDHVTSADMLFYKTGDTYFDLFGDPRDFRPGNGGQSQFVSGDSVYVTGYANAMGSDDGQILLDPVTFKSRWLNLRNRSNTIGFKLP